MSKYWLIALMLGLVMGWHSVSAQQSEPNDSDGDIRYVSDDLFIFMHSGPGRNYRILGSVQAGTKVTVLQIDSEKEFIEVIDNAQRTGWVESRFITQQQSIRQQLPQLQEQLQQVNQAYASEKQATSQLTSQLNQVNQQNEQLTKQVSQLTRENERMQKELDMQDKSEQMQWLTRGGIIALIGIILGVIIAYLPKKRRRNDQWM